MSLISFMDLTLRISLKNKAKFYDQKKQIKAKRFTDMKYFFNVYVY